MTLNPDLTDDVTVHTKRKDGTLHILLVDEIDGETLDEHAKNMAAMAGDGDADTVAELKDDLVESALAEALQANAPEAFEPSIPTVVNVDTDRDVQL